MELLEGAKFSKTCRLPDYWQAACSVWIETVSKLCVNFRYGDAPWEYLERTNSAILAGSLTASGAPAMPETYVMRNGVTSQQSERVDICVVTDNKNTTIIELVECKLAEYDASRLATAKQIASGLKKASDQVKNITGIHSFQLDSLPPNTEVKQTVVVIGLPCFEPGTPLFTMSNSIQNIIKALKSEGSIDLTAWVFPETYLHKPSKRYGNKFYPGTFLAVARVT